jgi:uncharacterized protein YeaO (DUF488 family)
MAAPVQVRRIYQPAVPEDGARILVDRVWPRGIRKDEAQLHAWARDVAPSRELRQWYGHDPEKFAGFRRRYAAELSQPPARDALSDLRALAAGRPVTLLTATRDLAHSHAVVLAGLLDPPAEGGEAACWAELVCPGCGAIMTEGHQPGCPAAGAG